MIIYPPLDKLMQKVDSRYTLVIATAKRARQLTGEDNYSDKPVITAVKEIFDGDVTITASEKYGAMSEFLGEQTEVTEEE